MPRYDVEALRNRRECQRARTDDEFVRGPARWLPKRSTFSTLTTTSSRRGTTDRKRHRELSGRQLLDSERIERNGAYARHLGSLDGMTSNDAATTLPTPCVQPVPAVA